MLEKQGIVIEQVIPGSIAEELGVEPGDRLLSIQGQLPRDYIDFVYLTSDDQFEILLVKPCGEEWLLDVERDSDEDLGIKLSGIIYDELKECSNHCMFCFVHQMPQGMRKTLSLKDDDYRFSFLQGSFVTLTNLEDREIQRIKNLRLSPLYVSVHTTNPELRKRMMGNCNAGRIMEVLRELNEVGIEFHTQIVLCPSINDGEELKRSIEDLATLRPNLLSLAIVPVGLTRYRDKLFPLTPYTADKAEEVYRLVDRYQKDFAVSDDNFIYLADEFYLLTQREFPPIEQYHGFPQLENGIGLSRLLLDELLALEPHLPERMLKPVKLLLVSSVLGAKVLAQAITPLVEIEGLIIDLLTVDNQFFGEQVTVTGLLTGQDLERGILKAHPEDYTMVVLPAIVLNDDDLFIDGMSREEFLTVIRNAIFVQDFTQLIDQLVELNLMEVKD